MKRILIVDDDPHILKLLSLYFEKDGFDVLCGADGEEALEILSRETVDAVLLDLMLPGKSGYDVLRELRKTSSVPVIILTARGDTFDKVLGLELGADDYVEKPFEPKELIARVRAVLRRANEYSAAPEREEGVARAAHLKVDLKSYPATLDGEEIPMPPKEFELLYHFVLHPNQVFSREKLLEEIWGFDYGGETRTVDVHITRLREKLDRHPHPEWQIKTVWGVGYKFESRDA